MGAWTFVDRRLEWVLDQIGAKRRRARYVGRPARRRRRPGMSLHLAQLKHFLKRRWDSRRRHAGWYQTISADAVLAASMRRQLA